MSGDKQQNPGSNKEKMNPKFAEFLIESLRALAAEAGDKELLEAKAKKLIRDAVKGDYIVMFGDEYVPKSNNPKKRQLGEKICAAITASGLDTVVEGDKPNKKTAEKVEETAEIPAADSNPVESFVAAYNDEALFNKDEGEGWKRVSAAYDACFKGGYINIVAGKLVASDKLGGSGQQVIDILIQEKHIPLDGKISDQPTPETTEQIAEHIKEQKKIVEKFKKALGDDALKLEDPQKYAGELVGILEDLAAESCLDLINGKFSASGEGELGRLGQGVLNLISQKGLTDSSTSVGYDVLLPKTDSTADEAKKNEGTEVKPVEYTRVMTDEQRASQPKTEKPRFGEYVQVMSDEELASMPKPETAVDAGRRKLSEKIAQIETVDNSIQTEVAKLDEQLSGLETALSDNEHQLMLLKHKDGAATYDYYEKNLAIINVIIANADKQGNISQSEEYTRKIQREEPLRLLNNSDNLRKEISEQKRRLHLKQIEFCVHNFKLESAKMLRAETEAENGQILQEHLVGTGAIDRALQARLKRSILVDGPQAGAKDNSEVNSEATLAGLDYIDWENPENNELLLKLLDLMEQGKLVANKETNRLYSPGSIKKDEVKAIRDQMSKLNKAQGTKAALELFGASDEIKAMSVHKRYSTALTTLKIKKYEYYVENKKETKITQTSGLKDILRLSNNEDLILKAKDLIAREIIIFDSTGDLVPNKSFMELDKNDKFSGYINTDKEYEDLCKEILLSLKLEQHNLTEKELQEQVDLDPINIASLNELEGLRSRLTGLKDSLGLPQIGDKPSLRTRSNMRLLHIGITDKQVQLSREYMDVLAEYDKKGAARVQYIKLLNLKIKSVAKARSDSVANLAGISALEPVMYESVCDITERFEACDQKNFNLGKYRARLADLVGVDTEAYMAVLTPTEVMEALAPELLDMAKRNAFNDVFPIVNHELRKNGLLNDESKHETIQGITGLFLQLDEVTNVMAAYENNVVKQEAYINYLKHLIVDANITENQSEQVRLVSAELEILKLEKLKLDTQLSFVISTRANQLKGDILQDKLGNPNKYGVKKEELEVFEFIKGQISNSATETAATVRSVDKQADAAISAVSTNYDDWSDSDTSSNYRAHSSSYAGSLGGSSSRLAKNKMKQGFLGGLAEVFGISWVVGR